MIRRVRRLWAAGFAVLFIVAPVALAAGSPAERDAARRAAENILAERRFQDPSFPSPLSGPLRWIGERVQDVVGAIFGPLEGLFDGAGWVILGVIALVVVAIVSLRLVRRRARAATPTHVRAGRTVAVSPDEIDREADGCEARGELARAVRLRFRAGLLRLAADGVIPRAHAITSREVARRTGSSTFAMVARSFDEIVYGERAPREDDLALSRDGWRDVRGEAAPGQKRRG